MAGYIHDDVREIMENAADPDNTIAPSTVGFTPEQLEAVNIMLQYSWNRGYKSACQDRDED